MKSKTLIVFLIFFSFSSCNSLKEIQKKNETSVFTPDALNADQNYFTKAVLEYHLVNAILKKYGKIISDTIDPDDPSKILNDSINIMSLNYPNVDNLIDTVRCKYKIPQVLSDLNSGFQYRYYLFSGKSVASMQAFGITDINTDIERQYLIIDYLQYKDCKCSNLPDIRYAVGLRSELKISNSSSDIDFNGIGSLANLAAKVQLGQTEVNFSLKTIGLTGYESRFNIPQGVSFDVTTYKDFQNAIEFLKEKLDDSDTTLIIHPEIIPIMDDYRPNFKNTVYGLTEEIISLSKMKSKIKKNNEIDSLNKSKLIAHIDNEISNLIDNRTELDDINDRLWQISRYYKLIQELSPQQEKLINRVYNLQANNDYEDIFGSDNLYSAYNNLVNLDGQLKNQFEIIYLFSDITLDGYSEFLKKINSLEIKNENLKYIIDELNSKETLNDETLNEIYNKLIEHMNK